MYLITKNKIADYIAQHPEAQTSFLTWLKEYPYWERAFKQDKNQPLLGILTSVASLGQGDYQIKYNLNPWLKTGYIIWLGTKEDFAAYEQAELEKLKIKYPDLKTVSVVIEVPGPRLPSSAVNGEKGKVALMNKNQETASISVDSPIDLTDVHLRKIPEIFPSKIDGYVSNELDFKTKSAYEEASNRAISIFSASPGTPEFEELTLLLPLIRHYEAINIELPRLALLEVIKLKMEMLKMDPSHLTFIIGSEEEVNQFLTGKHILPNKILRAVCKLLCIRIPLNDQSLIR